MLKKFFSKSTSSLEELCGNPLKTVVFFSVLLAVFYTVQHSLLQNVLGADTLLAFSNGAQKSLGNSTQPPLSGWLTYAVSFVGNHKDWVLYLATQLCCVVSVLYVYKSARVFYDEFAAGTAALLCCFTFFYNPSTVDFCSYPLTVMLIPVAAYNFFKALKDDKALNWVALGIFSAAGILNSYIFILVVLAFAVILFRNSDNRRHLKNIKLYVSMAVMLLAIYFHFKWLWFNDFITVKALLDRSENFKWYTPLLIPCVVLYLYAVMALVLFLANRPDFRTCERRTVNKTVGADMLLISLIPAAGLIVLAFTGNVPIMLCGGTAALAAVAAISFCPRQIDKKFFTRVVVMLELFSIAMMITSTIVLLKKSDPQVHSNPEAYTRSALNFYNKHSITQIPVIAGTGYEASLLQKYLPDHPPVCAFDDPNAIKRYRQKIKNEGALLIFAPAKDQQRRIPQEVYDFLKQTGSDQNMIRLSRIVYFAKARWGKRTKQVFYLGYLPPANNTQSIRIVPVGSK